MFKSSSSIIISMLLVVGIANHAHASEQKNWFLFGKNSPLISSSPAQNSTRQSAAFGTSHQTRQSVQPQTHRTQPISYARPSATAKPVAKAAARPPLPEKFLPQQVNYDTKHPKGTIIVDTGNKFLYLVEGNGKARRYGIGVARSGFEWSGSHKITRKAEWPGWTPPAEMRKREPHLPAFMPGGPENPLGARALYLGSTLYRIHGTAQPWTIGHNVSSGCIRLRNEDVSDLYARVSVGTRVVVQ